MTAAARATYAYDRIDQAQATLHTSAEFRSRRAVFPSLHAVCDASLGWVLIAPLRPASPLAEVDDDAFHVQPGRFVKSPLATGVKAAFAALLSLRCRGGAPKHTARLAALTLGV